MENSGPLPVPTPESSVVTGISQLADWLTDTSMLRACYDVLIGTPDSGGGGAESVRQLIGAGM